MVVDEPELMELKLSAFQIIWKVILDFFSRLLNTILFSLDIAMWSFVINLNLSKVSKLITDGFEIEPEMNQMQIAKDKKINIAEVPIGSTIF